MPRGMEQTERVRISVSKHERLEKLAKAMPSTVNALVDHAVANFLNDEEAVLLAAAEKRAAQRKAKLSR